jgi:hypothetical protein
MITQFTYTLPPEKLLVGDMFASDHSIITEVWHDPEGVWVVIDDYADAGYLTGKKYRIIREFID